MTAGAPGYQVDPGHRHQATHYRFSGTSLMFRVSRISPSSSPLVLESIQKFNEVLGELTKL